MNNLITFFFWLQRGNVRYCDGVKGFVLFSFGTTHNLVLNASSVVDLHLLLPFLLLGVGLWPCRAPQGSGVRECPVSWGLEDKKGYLGEESGESILEKGKSFWHSCTSPRCTQQVQPKFIWPGECQGQGIRLGLFFLHSQYSVCLVYCVILRRSEWHEIPPTVMALWSSAWWMQHQGQVSHSLCTSYAHDIVLNDMRNTKMSKRCFPS